jgi:putative DNA primase/helicase
MFFSAQELSLAHRFPIEKLIEQQGIKLHGRVERVGPCPRCGGHDRFAININKQVWNCRGCRQGGDVISLVQFLDDSDFRNACAALIGERLETGTKVTQRDPELERRQREELKQDERERAEDLKAHEAEQRSKALALWKRSIPATGTTAESYLRQWRNYRGPIPGTFRFLVANGSHPPAMIGAFGLADEPEPGILEIADDKITGIHITRLTADGRKDVTGKTKIFLGPSSGSPLVLATHNDLLGLVITEGIEDALTVHQATGLGAWAAGAANRMPKLAAVVPDYVEVVTIYAHADDGGQRYARELAEALNARGIEVFVEGIEL